MIHTWTLREMAARVRAREISPHELRDAHLRQIERVNPAINAFVRVCADTESSGEGPLAGVPVTVKDNYDAAGLPTLCGSCFREGHVADRDATAVARLRAAGAVILGKTNVPELVSSYETDNFVTGRTSHPTHPDFTPGGSSGGEAAAIASFCSPGGLGGDGGGSIRVPAHFCGIAGFKPTHRAIGGGGQFPAFLPPAGIVTAPGPLARTVGDVRLLFRVMQGLDPRDSLSLAPAPPMSGKPRIGVVRQLGRSPVHEDIAAAVETAATRLRALGFTTEDLVLEGLERAPNVWAFFFADLGAIGTREFLAGREAEAHWTITENLRPALVPDATAIAAQFAERERLRTRALDYMERCPVLLMPPCSIPAFRHRERRWQIGGQSMGLFAAMTLATTWNLLGFPALVQPMGQTAEGLPVGVQLVGRPFEDELVLDAGEQLEGYTG